MITCEACCREFKPGDRDKYCPRCGFHNGRGWWPRRGDAAAAEKSRRRENRSRKKRELQAQTDRRGAAAND